LIAEPYVKSRRAQSVTDDETWVPGEVNPTLNSFDMGDTRATTAIIEPVLMRQREGKPGGGKGPLLSNDKSLTLATSNDQTLFQSTNEPMLAFDTQFGSNANVFENQSPTLKASQQSPSVAYAIQDGRGMEKHQNGFGVASDGEPSYTLDQTGAQAVAYGIQGNVIGRQPHNGPAGKGHTEEGDPMFTLTSTDIHAVAYDEYNDSINDVHHALRAGTKQSTGVLLENDVAATLRSGGSGGVPSSRGEHLVTEPTMAVRRLTPQECEKLMGWEPDHTRWKADGTEQADTHRYRQCGNGVATPVAKWVAEQIAKVEHGEG
jgi:site-specific DNA-cytosine methylase